MVTVQILKNEKVIKQFTCNKTMMQKYFELACSIAGGMWNGKDKFEVVVN